MKGNFRLLLYLAITGLLGISFILFSLTQKTPEETLSTIKKPEYTEKLPVSNLPERPDRDTILFGASISKTGRLKAEGQRVIDGYELWKDHVNGQGGIRVGQKQYMVDILYYDDQSTKELARENTRKLILTDKVDFMLGPFSSGLTMVVSKVAEEHGVILVEACGASEAIFTSNPRATFAVLTSASWYLKDFIQMISQEEPKPETYAVLSPDKLFPRSVAKGVRIWFLQEKIEEVYYEIVPKNSDNYTKYLEEMAHLSPDIIVLTGHYRDSVNFTHQLANTPTLKPKAVVMTLGPTQRDYIKELGDAAEGMTGITQWEASSTFNCPIFKSPKDYAQMFKGKYGYEPTCQNAQSSAAGIIYQLALEKCETLDANEVLNQIRNLDTEIFYGKVKFDSRGLNIGHEMAVVQIQNGERKTVWPPRSAEAEFLYPLQ